MAKRDRELDGPPAFAGSAALTGLVEPVAGAMLAEAANAKAGVQRLLEAGLDSDAAVALARLLPIRRAIWWAVLSAWHGIEGQPDADQDEALAASVRWVLEPSEANRAAARQAGNHALTDNAPGCCATAAALAGRLDDDHARLVPDQVEVAASLVARAVAQAASRCQERGLIQARRQLVEIGLEFFDKPVP